MRGLQKSVIRPAEATNKAKAGLVAAALAGLLAASGCSHGRVCAPGAPGPDFQKAVLIRCLGGERLLDMYLSGFQSMPTSERIEFIVALQLAPCPPEALEWQAKNRKPAPLPSPSPKE